MRAHRMAVLFAVGLLAGCGCKRGPSTGPDASQGSDGGTTTTDGGTVPKNDGGWWTFPDAGYTPLTDFSTTGVLPARGPSAGGTTVTITGNEFYKSFAAGATDATPQTRVFFGTNEISGFQVIDNGRISAQTPPNPPGAVDITVINPNNPTGVTKCKGCFKYYEQLVLSSVAPGSGPTAGGTSVTLTGQGFTPSTLVQFGGVASPQVTVGSSTSITAVTPAAAGPGLVDVRVFNENGVADLRRAFNYADFLVTGVTPPGGPLAGGNTVTVTGTNFGTVTAVLFGAASVAPSASTSTTATATVPAGTAAGAVDVTVQTSAGNATLKQGYVYLDGSQSFSVAGVFPTHGPAAGGNTISVVGTGLGAATFTIGGAAAAVTTPGGNIVVLTVPSGTANTNADVAATSGSTVTLTGAYHYNLALTAVAPANGATTGGTAVTLTGAGFSGTLSATFGALAATGLTIGAPTSITASTPAGGGGPVDVTVRDQNDPLNFSVLPGGFTYVAPLQVLTVIPGSGSIAGGTLVTVLGAGFDGTTSILVGANTLKNVTVIDANTITGNTPPGSPGIVDVAAQKGTTTAVLKGGFAYFDPKSSEGGASGGPLQGTINVTVLDADQATFGAPIPQALVQLGTDPTTVFQGLTDNNGQITFSDPSLIKPVQVTVSKPQYLAVTVSNQQSENLTVFLFFNGGTPQPPSFPPAPPPAIISGSVYGFELAAPLTSTQKAWAEVWVAQDSLYGCPPWSALPTPSQRDASGEKWRITQDGGTYSVYASPGLHAVYAVFGIYDSSTQAWTPLLMGVARGVTTSPDAPATNVNIVLNMHLDQTVPVTIDNPPELPGSTTLPLNDTFAYFELGGDGVICMGDTTSPQPKFSIGALPEVLGDSLVFFNQATTSGASVESGYFAQQFGNLSALGLTIGPMFGLLQITTPQANAQFTGNIAFSLGAGPTPDMYEVIYGVLTPFGTVPLWHVVMPGTNSAVSIPANVLPVIQQVLQPTDQTVVLVIGSNSPRFEFSAWNYGQVGFGGISLDWTSFTYGGQLVSQ